MHPATQPDETFRLIVEAAPNAIVVIDESGRIVIVNFGVFGNGRSRPASSRAR
jgi:PAS domain-containing protein